MAGGSGTRLWPLSRADYPKQFLSLYGSNSDTMFQSTVKRLEKLNVNDILTVCNEEHRFIVAEQLHQIHKSGPILLEPLGKNTAPAIALASFSYRNNNEDPLLLILSADHIIENEVAFTKAVNDAIPLAESGKLVTFGITANDPNIGYGYIKKGISVGSGYEVDRFVEKPSIQEAKHYVESNKYFWNSGMFLFKASRYLEELKKYRSDIHSVCDLSMKQTSIDSDFLRVNEKKFNNCPIDSIDYAVMEKTSDAVVVEMSAGWNDLGSWSSLWNVSKKDSNNNVTSGDVIIHECYNSYFKSADKLIAAIGIKDVIVVSTKDVFMVVHKNHVQDVKIITEKIKADKRFEWKTHREVNRPWGKYDSIDRNVGYQVKKLTINPGAKLSVQMHYHRSEHWVVVSGQARVHYNNKSINLNVNESTYHGKQVVHSLENLGKTPLELIEVQVGEYLEEDDIVRFDDIYGRVKKKNSL